MKKPHEILREGAKTFEERQEIYGDSWLIAGETLHSLFPDGLTIKGPEEWNRLAIFMHQINKVRRQASQFKEGGHIDSSHDLMVYASMMEALEQNLKSEKATCQRDGEDKKYVPASDQLRVYDEVGSPTDNLDKSV